jgi:hypothetical protein
MNAIKIPWLIVMFAWLAGCSVHQTMDGIMSSWAGSDIAEVVAQWGAPQEIREFKANKLYVWNHTTAQTTPKIKIRTTSISGNTGSSGSSSTGSSTTYANCQRLLEVDAEGNVVDWQWNGNGCPYREGGPYSNWRRKETRP